MVCLGEEAVGVNDPFVANGLLQDGGALRERMAEDGYLFVRRLIDPGQILDIRREVLERCREQGLLDPSVPIEAAKPAMPRSEAPGAAMATLSRKLFGLEAVHVLFHSSPITDLIQVLVGEAVVPHVHKQVRVQFPIEPGQSAQVTSAHQDFVYNQGATDVYTCWLPIGDVSRETGGLQVMAGSHKHGVYDVHAPDDGSITYGISSSDLTGEWVSPDYRMGDAIIFHSLTVHRAPENRSDHFRFSMDCRYQGISQPFSEKLLSPLPGVEEAYPEWKSEALKYYWQRLELKTIEHDLSYYEKIDAEMRARGKESNMKAAFEVMGKPKSM
jgi:ectoine hydroxylase-related dioxygenase (phytanoyl-CoA dioxygenase family)